MALLKNLSIGKKLGIGFGLVLILTSILAIVSIFEISKVNGSTVDIATNWLPSVKVLGTIAFDAASFRRFELAYLLSPNEAQRATSQTGMSNNLDALSEDIKEYEPMISSDEERGLYKDWRDDWHKYIEMNKQVMDLSRSNKTPEAVTLSLSGGFDAFKTFSSKLNEDVVLNSKGAADATAGAASAYSAAKYWILGLSIGAIALGLTVAIGLARAISSSTTKMLATIEQVAANNLAIDDMEITSSDEIGRAGVALNKMKNNLREIIESISGTAQQVAKASTELSETSQQITANSQETSAQAGVVSSATQQVSQNLQTVATGAEEMGASIKEIAKNATEAAKVSTSAVQVAESTNATVAKLGESSAEIGQVIKVITSIAQQTNLLALNATIEAARAGEAGK
ncbi:MAG: methyl-accepting chemotaxis protein, partial [Candidatus Acidiferrales bacterium]